MLYASGALVKPITISSLGFSPGAGEMVKRWSTDVKKRNNSILAKCSPTHARLPGERKTSNRSERLHKDTFVSYNLGNRVLTKNV